MSPIKLYRCEYCGSHLKAGYKRLRDYKDYIKWRNAAMRVIWGAHRNMGVTITELVEVTGLSRSTIKQVIKDGR